VPREPIGHRKRDGDGNIIAKPKYVPRRNQQLVCGVCGENVRWNGPKKVYRPPGSRYWQHANRRINKKVKCPSAIEVCTKERYWADYEAIPSLLGNAAGHFGAGG